MIRNATAIWRGGPGAGDGTVSTSSGVIRNALYSFASGSGDEPCTSPGEMLAAAQASCVSLMFAQELAKAGIRPAAIQTNAKLTVEEVDQLWTITSIHLNVSVEAEEMEPDLFRQVVQAARRNCPISRALNAEITMDAMFKPTAIHALA